MPAPTISMVMLLHRMGSGARPQSGGVNTALPSVLFSWKSSRDVLACAACSRIRCRAGAQQKSLKQVKAKVWRVPAGGVRGRTAVPL